MDVIEVISICAMARWLRFSSDQTEFKNDSDNFHYAKIAGYNLLADCQCNAKIPVIPFPHQN